MNEKTDQKNVFVVPKKQTQKHDKKQTKKKTRHNGTSFYFNIQLLVWFTYPTLT